MGKTLLTIKELQKELNKSRATIFNYIKKGMPCVKKGRMNLFDIDEVRVWLERQKVGGGYVKAITEAQELHPNDPIQQLEFIREKGNFKYYTLALIEIAQSVFSSNSGVEVKFPSRSFDYFYRGFLQAIRIVFIHAEEEEINYIGNRIESVVMNSIKQKKWSKYKVMTFETAYGTFEETLEDFNSRSIYFAPGNEHHIFWEKRCKNEN